MPNAQKYKADPNAQHIQNRNTNTYEGVKIKKRNATFKINQSDHFVDLGGKVVSKKKRIKVVSKRRRISAGR